MGCTHYRIMRGSGRVPGDNPDFMAADQDSNWLAGSRNGGNNVLQLRSRTRLCSAGGDSDQLVIARRVPGSRIDVVGRFHTRPLFYRYPDLGNG